jgi:leader peptidase (prepilin peptidase)/N-methyltransferase
MEALTVVLVGLALGSFLNVVIHRVPKGMSLVRPPSTCPKCGKGIKPYDNIPVLSFLILRGKCRFCRAPIAWSYPLVELATGLTFLLLWNRFDLTPDFFAACVFSGGLIALSVIDFYHQILPEVISLPLIGLAFGYAFLRPGFGFLRALLGAAVGAGFLLLIYGAYYLLRKKEGLGLGDVILMVLIGAFLGWKLVILTLILASFVGALVGIFLISFRKKGLQHALPFGTFLGPAAIIALLWGDRVIAAYLTLFPK